jgi:hypothetical protein
LLNIKVIIYSKNADYHRQWTKKYKIFLGVFSTPEQIFEKLLNFQEGFKLIFLI